MSHNKELFRSDVYEAIGKIKRDFILKIVFHAPLHPGSTWQKLELDM